VWWWGGCEVAAGPTAGVLEDPPADANVSAPELGPPAGPPWSADAVEVLLFGAVAPGRCAVPDRPRCLLELAYHDDPASLRLALDLYATSGGVAGVEEPYWMDGGFRGRIQIVPERPVGEHRVQLARVAAAEAVFERFGTALRARATHPIRWRHRPVAWRFFRSVGRKTPSAYASSWTVGFNVVGSLNTSEEKVIETLFHEIFHLNDQGWSRPALGVDFDAIVARCGVDAGCLAPYAPGDTRVRNGTYYAFQPNNGDACVEYAAELALRYYRESSRVLAGKSPGTAFKCGPAENARAWSALVAAFFGGVDVVPACSP
jgi:hypothetical protein